MLKIIDSETNLIPTHNLIQINPKTLLYPLNEKLLLYESDLTKLKYSSLLEEDMFSVNYTFLHLNINNQKIIISKKISINDNQEIICINPVIKLENDYNNFDLTKTSNKNNVLSWDGTQWVPDKNISSDNTNLSSIIDIMFSDVNITSIVNEVLSWDGFKWIPDSLFPKVE